MTKPEVSQNDTAGPFAQLVIPGAPRTKKTSNEISMSGGRKVVKPSPYWLLWRDRCLIWWAKQPLEVRRRRIHRDVEVNCAAIFYRDRRLGDAVGYYQGLADVLEEIQVVANDKQIVTWDGSRLRVDHVNPRVELTLTLSEESTV